MKKQTARYIAITLASVLLVSVCCFGVYRYLENKKSSQGGQEVIFQFSPSSVESIKILNENDKYELEKEDNGLWKIDNREDKKLVQQSVIDAVNVFSLVKGTEISSENLPYFTIRVEIDKKFTETVFELAKDKENYYLRTKRGKVYSVSQVLYSVAERKGDFYRDKTVTKIKSFGKEGENEFKSYNFKYKDEEGKAQEINVRLKNSGEISVYDNSSPYMITSPYLKTADANFFESKVLTKIPEIKAERFISDKNADLSSYGLDKNTRKTLTVSYDNSYFVLYVGDDVSDLGEIYCMTSGSNEIFTVKKSNLDFLEYNSSEIADKSIFPYNIEYIKNITVEKGDFKLSLVKDGENYYINERAASKDTAQNFFDRLKELKASGEVYEDYNGGGFFKITITASDGKAINLRAIKTNDGKVLITDNGRVYQKLDNKSIDALIEKLKQL